MKRNPARGLAFELLFALGLVIISEAAIRATDWSRFWVLIAVFTTGNVARWLLKQRRSRSSASNAQRTSAAEPTG